jgi:hypothetical protein
MTEGKDGRYPRLTESDRKAIVKALECAWRETLNGIDYADPEAFEEECEIDRKYETLIRKIDPRTVLKYPDATTPEDKP